MSEVTLPVRSLMHISGEDAAGYNSQRTLKKHVRMETKEQHQNSSADF